VWAKQTAVSAPIAIALAYLFRQPKYAVMFVLVQVIPSLGILAWLEASSGGQFSRHVLFGNALNPFNFLRMVARMLQFILLQFPVLVAAVWWIRRGWTWPPSPIHLYVPLALLTAFSVGNEGSSWNYVIEAVVGAALAVPFAWRAAPRRLAMVAPLLAVVQLLLVLHLPNGSLYFPFPERLNSTPVEADYANGALVDEAVRATPGSILAEPAGFAVRNGRTVYIQPIDLRAEEYHGRWDSTLLLDSLRGGQFGLVIEEYRLFPFGMEDVLATDFDLVQEIPALNGFTYRLYRPRGADAASMASS
jgi:hypothetical protein